MSHSRVDSIAGNEDNGVRDVHRFELADNLFFREYFQLGFDEYSAQEIYADTFQSEHSTLSISSNTMNKLNEETILSLILIILIFH